jgi:beta-1,4-glucosyltransferase
MNIIETMDDATQVTVLPIAGYQILKHDKSSLLAEIRERMASGQKTLLFFANTNFVVQCRKLRTALRQRDVLIVNDGIGMDMAAQLTHSERFIENLNGTDFVPALLRASPVPLRIFLYGGKPESVGKAAQAITAMGQVVVGSLDGYQQDRYKIRSAIEAAQPDIVLVALGNPLQERWILENADSLSARVFIGVGALFDFLSGTVSRAPEWVRKIRMEWFYRLCREPRRLGRRYTLDILIFFRLCLNQKFRS